MEYQHPQISKETWLEEVRELIVAGDLYLRFLFQKGQILAKLSRPLVDGKKIVLRQQSSGLSDSFPIELWIDPPDEPMARYEKRTNTTDGVCLSITYKTSIGDRLVDVALLHLSNQENLSDRASSESLLP